MKKIFVLFLLSSAMTALSQTPVWPPAGGGGGGGSVTSVAATGTALVNATVVNPTTTPTVVLTLPNQPANSVVGNFTGSAAAPVASATPTFSAVNLNSFPLGQFSVASQVSPISNGLIGEYHLNEASGATVGIDYSGNGNNGTYVGTPTLAGTTAGGMISAGAGYMSYPSAINTALTFSTYTCSSALATNTSTYPLLIGGLMTATAPSSSNIQAFGMMMLSTNIATLPGFPGKYAVSPSSLNQNNVLTVANQTADGCHLLTWVRGTTNDQFYIDGAEVASYFFRPAGSSAVTLASGTFALGMPPYATLPNASFAYPYPIYFNFAFNRALTASEVQSLAGSAQSYAQFRGIIKIPTTFSDAGNQLLFVGDSITFGYLTTTPWPRTVTIAGNLNNTYIPITGVAGITNNIASASWQLEGMINECTSRGYGAMNPNSNTTVIIWGGTNDVATSPAVTAAVAYQRLRRLVQCYKAAPHNPRVFVLTMLSRGTPGGLVSPANDLLKNQLNDLIRKDYAGSDGMIDVASFAGLGADGASVNPTAACNGSNCFNLDAVHPIDAGASIIASGVEGYVNWADAVKNGSNPKFITTGSTYQEVAGDTAIATNPVAAQAITLPAITSGAAPSFLVGTDRYINNLSAFTVTVTPASGEVIDGNSAGTGVSCPATTKCSFRAVLGATPGLATADATSGAHWEQFGFSGGGGGSGNATSIQSIPVSATAPTSSQVLGYNGTNWIPTTVAGGTVPTGTGYYTIASGVANPTATALPIASSSVQGISNCDNVTITCGSGILTAVGGAGNATSLQSVAISATAPTSGQVLGYNGTNWIPTAAGGGGAGLTSNTFTGIQIMPSLQDTVVNDTGLVNVAVLANTSVTALSSGEILTWNPVAANTIPAPTLNVNSLGAKTITRFGNVALAANDLVIGTTAVVIYNSAGSGTWQLLNPATSASTVAPTFTGTTGVSTLNYTSSITKGGGTVHPINACAGAISPTPVSGTSVYTCSVTGGSTSSICQAFPTNAAAQLLWGGTGGAVAPLAGNIPTAIISSGSTLTITFRTTANVQAVAGGETFNAQCTIN